MLPEAWGSVRLSTGCCFPHSPVLGSPSSVSTPLRGPHPYVQKGKDASVVAASASLPPSLPPFYPPPSLGKPGLLTRWAQNSLRGELQPFGMQCRETHAFLLSFPKNKVVPFAFPFWFLLKTAYVFLPR